MIVVQARGDPGQQAHHGGSAIQSRDAVTDHLRAVGNVLVGPSAACELGWLLFRAERLHNLNQAPTGADCLIDSRMRRRIATFWSDGVRGFGELPALAALSGCFFGSDCSGLVAELPGALQAHEIRDLGLSAERPDERNAVRMRLERLACETDLLREYSQLLSSAWATVEPVWLDEGLALSLAACDRWCNRLGTGQSVLELLPADHGAFSLGLSPLVAAAEAAGKIALTPVHYLLSGHVFDLGHMVALGVATTDDPPINQYRSRGLMAADYGRLLAHPTRAALTSLLLQSPLTTAEAAQELGLSVASIGRELRRLQAAALVERVAGTKPARYRTIDGAPDKLLNEISARIHSVHGRVTQSNAVETASGADFRAIFNNAPLAIIQLDLNGHCLSCNGAAEQMLGYPSNELGQLRMLHLLAEASDHDMFELLGRAPQRSGQEVRLRCRDGSVFWAAITVSEVKDQTGNSRFAYAMIEDVSSRRAAEDAVTRLPNRALFQARLDRLLAQGRDFALLMIDLDRFKHVNDTYGHDAGDELLKQVSQRVTSAVRASDMVARLGGDEFAVLATDITSRNPALTVARKIRASLRETFLVMSNPVNIDASIGIAISGQDGTTATALAAHADQAMYETKRAGRLRGSEPVRRHPAANK